MTPDRKRELVAAQDVSTRERAEVANLAALCNQYEGSDLPAEMDPAATPATGATNQFLCYQNGTLVGFVSLQQGMAEIIGGNDVAEIELCGMVHPAHRRTGFGRMLLAGAHAECVRRSVASCLITCDRTSESGKAFAMAVGAHYSHSEYRMKLDPTLAEHRPQRARVLEFRAAGVGDLGSIICITTAAFGDREDEVRRWLGMEVLEPASRLYVASLDDEPIGSARVSQHSGNVFITTLGVLPVYQHRGYGREILERLVDQLIGEGRRNVMIEVVTENRNALNLYRSCGFNETSTYDYYRTQTPAAVG